MDALGNVHRELADDSLVRALPVKVRLIIDFLFEKFGEDPAWSEA